MNFRKPSLPYILGRSLLAACYLLTQAIFVHAAELNIWKERQNSVRFAHLPLPQMPLYRSQSQPVVPQSSARIEKVLKPAGRDLRQTIIHIQDVHANHEAQRNIGSLIEQLAAQQPIGLIALEGAFGPVDVAFFRNNFDPASLKKAARYLLTHHKISGPVLAALTHRADLRMVGIDDEAAYNANVQAYQQSRSSAAALKKEWAQRQREIAAAKQTMFNPELKKFDAVVEAHRKGEIPFGDYVRAVYQRDPSRYPHSHRFLHALAMEKKLDRPGIERQRAELLQLCTTKFDTTRLRTLAAQTNAYRSGVLSHHDFYQALREHCAAAGIDLKRFPLMAHYMNYVAVSQDIEAESLFRELQEQERARFAALARTAEEVKLARLAREGYLTGKLLDFALTRDEWKEFGSVHRQNLAPFEAFYRQAEIRDQKMAKNLRDVLSSEKLEIRSNNSLPSTQNVVVLVTGGFHSSGIDRHLTQAGYTVVLMTPRLTKVDSADGTTYLSLFAQEKTPLEKLFDGKRLFLSLPVLPPADRIELAATTQAIQVAAGVRPSPSTLTVPPGVDVTVQKDGDTVRGDITAPTGAKVQFDLKPTNKDPGFETEFKSPSRFKLPVGMVTWWAKRMVKEGYTLEQAAEQAPHVEELVYSQLLQTIPYFLGYGLFSTHLFEAYLGVPVFWIFRAVQIALLMISVIHFAWAHKVVYKYDANRFLATIDNPNVIPGRLQADPNPPTFSDYFKFALLGLGFRFVYLIAIFLPPQTAPLVMAVAYPVAILLHWLWNTQLAPRYGWRVASTANGTPPPQKFTSGRTNGVKKIDMGVVVKIDHSEKQGLEDAIASTGELDDADFSLGIARLRAIEADQVHEEIARFHAAYAAYPPGQLNSRKVGEFYRLYQQNIVDVITQELISAADAIDEVVKRQQAITDSKKEAVLETLDYGADLSGRLRGEMQSELPITASGVILVVRNPNKYRMNEILEKYKDVITAVIWDGEYKPLHWNSDLAQGFGVAVLGSFGQPVFDSFKEGGTAIVDTINGTFVQANPVASDQESADTQTIIFRAMQDAMKEMAKEPVMTADRKTVAVGAVRRGFIYGRDKEAADFVNQLADGNIGLFRTEFLYPRTEPEPEVEDLKYGFLETANAIEGVMSVRAIDRKGGDKDDDIFRQMETPEEAEARLREGNGSSLRWILETEVGRRTFKKQAMALLSAYEESAKQNIRFFIPMAETPEQVQAALNIFNEAKRELHLENSEMKFGVMIETRLALENRAALMAVEGISFVSIGTRDLLDSMKHETVLEHPEYLEAIKQVVLEGIKQGKSISICGEHASNDAVVLLVNSLPGVAEVVQWSVVDNNIPAFKAFVQTLNIAELSGLLPPEVDLLALEDLIGRIIAERDRVILNSVLYGEKFHHRLIEADVKRGMQASFTVGADPRFPGVSVLKVSPGRLPEENLGHVSADFTLANILGRMAASMLEFTAANGNEALTFLARIEQHVIDRLILGNDAQYQTEVVGSEGHREGMSQGYLPVGSVLGMGKEQLQMVVLAMENEEGLINPEKKGTLVARAFGKKGSFKPMPDGHMFKVVVSRALQQMDLSAVLNDSRHNNQVNTVQAALTVFEQATQILGRAPKIAVLCRERHESMIEELRAKMGIPESFQEMYDRLKKNRDGRIEFLGSNGTLELSEDDDWSGGLRLGKDGEADVILGIGGTPEAIISALLVKKLGGQFAGTLVPYGNAEQFSPAERAAHARFPGLNPFEILDQDQLVPGDRRDLALFVGVLSDFKLDEDTTLPGPVITAPGQDAQRKDGEVDFGGRAIVSVMWVGGGEVRYATLSLATSIITHAALHEEYRKDRGDEAKKKQFSEAMNLAFAYARFGKYAEADKILSVWKQYREQVEKDREQAPEKMGRMLTLEWPSFRAAVEDPALAARLEVMDHFVAAGRALVQHPHGSEKACIAGLDRYKAALSIVHANKMWDLEAKLELRRRIRRIYYWLRDRGEVDKNPRTLHYSAEAVAHTDGGFETLTRHYNLQLKVIVDPYRAWSDDFLGTNKYGPDLSTRLEKLYELYTAHRDDSTIEYFRESAPASVNLWNVLLFLTVLSGEPAEDQAKVIRFLERDPAAKEATQKMLGSQLPDKEGTRNIFRRLIDHSKKKNFTLPPAPSDSLLPEQILAGPYIDYVLIQLEREQALDTAPTIFRRLIRSAIDKADMMTSLGKADSRRIYLEKAASYADIVIKHPELMQNELMGFFFDFAYLYRALAAITNNEEHRDAANFYVSLIGNKADFSNHLLSLKTMHGELIYPDRGVIRTLAGQLAVAIQPVKHLLVNSVIYYSALLVNRMVERGNLPRSWRIQNPAALILPGFVLEAAIAIFLIPFYHQGFFLLTVAFSALHVLLWMAERRLAQSSGEPAPLSREAGLRFLQHLLAFLPYVAAAQIYSFAGPSLLFHLTLIAAVAFHFYFDLRPLAAKPSNPLVLALAGSPVALGVEGVNGSQGPLDTWVDAPVLDSRPLDVLLQPPAEPASEAHPSFQELRLALSGT